MKLRAFLLLSCLVVVPAAAMFSHHVPPAVRGLPRQLLAALVARLSAGRSPEPPRPIAEPKVPAAAAAGFAAPFVAAAEAGAGTTALEQLAALGAVAIECRPLVGGGQIASCRLPVDAEGQLHRVFQARGPDAETATRGLATEVTAWRHRVAGLPPAVPGLW